MVGSYSESRFSPAYSSPKAARAAAPPSDAPPTTASAGYAPAGRPAAPPAARRPPPQRVQCKATDSDGGPRLCAGVLSPAPVRAQAAAPSSRPCHEPACWDTGFGPRPWRRPWRPGSAPVDGIDPVGSLAAMPPSSRPAAPRYPARAESERDLVARAKRTREGGRGREREREGGRGEREREREREGRAYGRWCEGPTRSRGPF